jgi:hypothetical protein
MKLRSTRTLLAIGLTAAVGGAVALFVTGTAQAATATATFTKTQDWGTGFQGQYTIHGGSAGLSSWTVEFDLPSGTTVGSYWDTLITSSGNHYIAKNREYNGTVAPNGSVSFGFIGSGSGSPSNCKLNGGACNGSGGGGGGDTSAPSVPGGLKVTGTTSSSVSLSWNASTDNVGVTGYEVRRNGSSVGTPGGTSFTDSGLAASTSYGYQVRARDAAGNWSGWSGTVSGTTQAGGGGGGGGGGGSMAAAPYLYEGWGDPPAPGTVMSATGIKWFTMAFILSNGSCAPAWDGNRSLTGGVDASTISAIRSAGGDALPSIGGWSGNKLGEFCSSASALAGAYQTVINAFHFKAIDIDIESTEFESDANQQKVVDALKIVKANNAGIKTILTFGTSTTGPNWWGQQLIKKAAAAGSAVDIFTIMPFDFGGGNMSQSTQSAAEGLKSQLMSAFGWSADTAYRHMGISSMNGKTDQSETVTPTDFTNIKNYASSHHLARLSFWSVNRDRPCPGGGTVSNCSGIDQQQWQFTKILAGFTG